MAIAVFDHDNRRVYQQADGKRQPAQRHDIRGDVQVIQRQERDYHRDGQGEDGDQGRAKVEEKDDDHQADNYCLFEEVALKRADGFVDQPGAIVGANNFDTWRQRAFDLLNLLLDPVDHVQGIHAIAHNYDAAHGLAFALPLGHTLADVGAQRHGSQIADQDGRTVLRRNRHRLQIGHGLKVAQAADHVARATHLQHSPADLIGALPDTINHGGERNVVGEQLVGVKLHLILPYKAADARYFGDAGYCFKLVPELPVLNAAQFGE